MCTFATPNSRTVAHFFLCFVGQVEKKQHGDSGHFGFRQNIVEDIFSYARHNRVDELERMMDQ